MRRWGVLVLVMLPGLAWGDADRVVVPISQTMLPNGDIRYSVPVQIGDSAALPALLDTGSTGLRVMQGAVYADRYNDTGAASISEFGGGDKLTGSVGTARVSVGPETTDDDVPFEVVTQAGCADFRPDCSASMVSAADYGIGGDGIARQGFQAILGVSLAVESGPAYLANPLTHMGARKWIVTLPEPGQSGAGALILNPDEQDLQGFQMFPLTALPSVADGLDSGWVDAVPGCIKDESNGENVCGPAILDTGSPGVIADVVGGAQTAPLWTQGDQVTMSFNTGSQTMGFSFVADRNPGTGLLQEPAQGASPRLLDGFLPFFYNDVLYDAADGEVGLRPRNDAPTSVAPETASDNVSIEVIQLNAPSAGAPKLPVVITPSQ